MSPKLLNILLILIPAVLYYGYLDPMYNGTPGLIWTPESGIMKLKSENVQMKNALLQLSFIETEVKKLNDDYKKVDPLVKQKAEMLLPDSIDSIKLRNEVLSIADNSGVAISALIVMPAITGKMDPNLKYYTVSFGIKSRYSVFKKAIESYEKSTRLFILDSVAIVKAKKSDTQVQSSVVDDSEALDIRVTFKVASLK